MFRGYFLFYHNYGSVVSDMVAQAFTLLSSTGNLLVILVFVFQHYAVDLFILITESLCGAVD